MRTNIRNVSPPPVPGWFPVNVVNSSAMPPTRTDTPIFYKCFQDVIFENHVFFTQPLWYK